MGEPALRALFFIIGAFALFSAGLKGRKTMRAGMGVSLLTVLEGAAGVVLMVTTLPGVFVLPVAGGVAMVTAVVVLASTTVHLVQIRAASRAREESEGSRLYATLKYGLDDGSPEEAPVEAGSAEPGDGFARPGESPAEVADTEAVPEPVDPITAALQSGHFDEGAFLRSASTGSPAEPGDAELVDAGDGKVDSVDGGAESADGEPSDPEVPPGA